ncbi:antiterminator Q family protein [Escherichia coli]|uniref:antiterminator Q family protein n=4 Tax=Escherichia coli TaxID=562 RepID=UPI000A9DF6B7|nr:antiterminator Q family protein [Escherichia coli]
MRDIQMVLERWGAWAANNHEDVTWSSIAAGFKGLIPSKVKSRPQCCDDDAMIICGCMARLKKNNSDLHDLLVDYYVVGMTFMSLAGKHCCSDGYIGKRLQKAEGIIEGMWICPYISRHLLSLNPLLACCRRYSRGER